MKSFVLLILATTLLPALWAQEPASGAAGDVGKTSPAATGFSSLPVPTASPVPAAAPVELYSLDYDENLDVFYAPGTKTLYTGRVISTHENGKQELVGALKDGKRDGRWIQYYDNGTLMSAGNYLSGLETGEWKYWFENAVLQGVGSYKDGKPAGVWKEYFEDGKPQTEGAYLDGEMDGIWKVSDEGTGKVRELKFKNGVQID